MSSVTLDDLQTEIDVLKTLTDEDALVQDDTGTHYQTTYTYFYVPASAGSASSSTDDSGLGTLLRLGEYSDVEETAYNAGSDIYSAYYPAQHIEDESAAAIYTNAAGGGKGILMACDGRILVRGGEKMYLNTAGNIHVQSDEGSVTIESGTDSNSAAQNIYLIAADGNGDLETTVFKDTKTVNGEQYEKVTSVSRKYYEANKYDIYHAEQYKEVHEKTTSIHHAENHKFFYGGALSIKFAGEFIFTLAVSLNIEPISKITLYALKTDIGIAKIDILAFKTEIKDGKFSFMKASFKGKAVEAKTTAVKAESTPVKAGTGMVTAEQIQADCKNVNVKAMIAAWEAKIASTAQI
ncbi:hypothetical protein E1180_04910 [Roseibium denhamense]|uniref:Uncharacterized protein n=1 Tax=Roseibium denhamense TaxID=76305 RepID=A0ABY1NW58_9HYPH|nr:hypothetical protein [Roseibium denhamense]MTI04853.1 hypothetical protein [Roseibium denhamense]SMP19946.1 hypothetical protein SAMN06265374_2079 [Roseibium denhamense]